MDIFENRRIAFCLDVHNEAVKVSDFTSCQWLYIYMYVCMYVVVLSCM